MRIYVTQEDINCGAPNDSEACPIALAVSRRFPKDILRVDGNNGGCWCVYFNEDSDGENPERVIELPYEAARFANRFDGHEPVKPFAFNLTTTTTVKRKVIK